MSANNEGILQFPLKTISKCSPVRFSFTLIGYKEVCVRMRVRVCVCKRERERESWGSNAGQTADIIHLPVTGPRAAGKVADSSPGSDIRGGILIFRHGML